jgi:hypothetical protein
MKKDAEMSNEPMMSQSTSNIELENESANTFPATLYSKACMTKPAEILMSLILPTVTDRLKYHQEKMKLKGSDT